MRSDSTHVSSSMRKAMNHIKEVAACVPRKKLRVNFSLLQFSFGWGEWPTGLRCYD